MQVYLDDEAVIVSQPTLAAALEAGRDAAQNKGRVVIEATLDGEPIPDTLLDNPPDDPIEEAEVHFRTTDPAALVRTTLKDVGEAVEKIRPGQRHCAEQIQAGQLAEGLGSLADVLRIWEALHQTVANGSSLLGIDLDTITLSVDGNDIRVTEAVDQLSTHLGSIKRAVDNQDWSDLADVLMYDLDEQAALWSGLLAQLADHIKANHSEG